MHRRVGRSSRSNRQASGPSARRVAGLRPQLHRCRPLGWTASRSTGRCPAPGEVDMCSASALNDFRQLGSAAPELRSTWRRRSSCSTAGSCWPSSMTSSAARMPSIAGVPEAAAGRRTGRTRSSSTPASIMSAATQVRASSTEACEQLKGRSDGRAGGRGRAAAGRDRRRGAGRRLPVGLPGRWAAVLEPGHRK